MFPDYDPVSTYRILGIDPGTDTLGTAFMDVDLLRRTMTVAHAATYSGEVMGRAFSYFGEVHGNRSARIRSHEENLYALMFEARPHAIVVESPFMGKFAQAYMALVECMCAIQRAAFQYNPAIAVVLIDPTSVKKSTGMVGRMQGKEPVRKALSELSYLQYGHGVRLDFMDEHSVDATAVAHWRACQIIQCLIESPYEHR